VEVREIFDRRDVARRQSIELWFASDEKTLEDQTARIERFASVRR
jgi:hypothetical protein